jgi:hypothetical protein
MKCTYSNGKVVDPAVAVIWSDNHNERSGFFRAYWSDSPDGTTGSPVIGYCSPGGSHRTIRQVVAEFRRMHPGEAIYRNGKLIK